MNGSSSKNSNKKQFAVSVCKDLDHSDALKRVSTRIKANSFESSCLDCFNNCFALGGKFESKSPATVSSYRYLPACWCVTELRRYSTISQDTTPRLRKESSGIKSSRNEWDMGMASKTSSSSSPPTTLVPLTRHCSDGDSNWLIHPHLTEVKECDSDGSRLGSFPSHLRR